MADPEVKNYNGNKVAKEGTKYSQVPYFKTEAKPQPSFAQDVQNLGQQGYGLAPAAAKATGMAIDRNVTPVAESIGAGIRSLGKAAFATPEQPKPVAQPATQAPITQGPATQAAPKPVVSGEPPIAMTQAGYFDRQAQVNGGMSGTPKTKYALNENGQPIKMDAATGQVSPVANRITQNVLKPGEKPFVMTRENTGAPGGSAGIGFDQITKAMDRGDISAADGQAVYQNANMSPAQRQQKALMQTAFTQPDGQTPIGSIGGMKRNAATATALLSKQMDSDSNAAEYGARRESALAKMAQDQMQFDRNQKNADKALQLKQTGVNLDKAKRKQEMFAGRNEDSMYLDFLKREGGDNPTPEVIGLADRAYQDYLDQTLSQM